MSNEKHDALYSSARVVLNSNVKRLWFNVNPFLEKKPTLTGTPEPPSKFIQPLQSTLVCEKYLQDCSCGNVDIQIEDFWEFLSAGDFSGGYSVRVLEGQLLEYLMTSLMMLKRTGDIIDHKSFAFARNERERRGCYKLANQMGCGVIKETLLIELTYYGRSRKKLEAQNSEWSSYPETFSTTTTSDFLSMQSSKFDSEDEVTPYQSMGSKRIVAKKINRDQSRSSNCRSKMKQKPSDNSSHGSTDNEFAPPAKLDLKKFSCTEKTPYSEAQDESSDNASSDDEYYGEEFYLSDLVKKGFEDGETVQDRLRKRRDEINNERNEAKRAVQEWTSRRTKSYLNFKQFDADKDYDMPNLRLNYNFLTKVPTLEEFICILEEFEKFDPRFKKQKQLNKKVAKQYKLQKENGKEKDTVFGRSHMVTAVQKASFFSLGLLKKKPKPSEIKLPLLEKLRSKRKLSVFGKSDSSPTDDKLSPLGKNALLPLAEDCPDCMARIVLGITDSKPCEQHMAENMPKSKHPMAEAAKGRRQSISRRRLSAAIPGFAHSKSEMPSIYVHTPSGTTTCIHDQPVSGVHRIPKIKSKPSDKSSKSIKSTQGSQIEPQEKTDSFSTDAEPEENKNVIVVESTPSLFDTNKLNCRYSFEKLRGKGYHKKKPAFYKVLKKYYRMHTAVTVFNEPVTRRGKRMSILQQIIDQKTKERMLPRRKPKMKIGTLKKYSFQDQEISRTPFEEAPEFKHIDNEKFRESFLKALDEFVVRKELVISSHGSTVSTTITFTKKSIFLRTQD